MTCGRHLHRYVRPGVEPINLEVDWSIEENRIVIIGAALFKPSGKYFGYWSAKAMPKDLIKTLRHDIYHEIVLAEWEVNPDQD